MMHSVYIFLNRAQTDVKEVYGSLCDADVNAIDWLKISNVDVRNSLSHTVVGADFFVIL
jgi:hypothetical protein